MALRNIDRGLGPVVYLLMTRGRMICIGTIGTPTCMTQRAANWYIMLRSLPTIKQYQSETPLFVLLSKTFAVT